MIPESEYFKRRAKLVNVLKPNSLCLLLAAEYKVRSNDSEYPYRQNSNFYYLSGFKEDQSALLFLKKNKKTKTILFVAKKDKLQELWNGKRCGIKRAKKLFDVDEVYGFDELEEKLALFTQEKKHLYFDFANQAFAKKYLRNYLKSIKHIHNIAPHIEQLRLIKSDAEIKLIKKAISITKEAHHRAMTKAKELRFEYELQAELEYEFKKNGAYSDAYTSIVACGNAANTLHYISNNKALKKGELILIDAGCEYEYYASDITRTIPASGKFSKEQKELYEMVLEVQLRILSMIKPGVKRSELQKEAVKLLTKGMIDLGILQGSIKHNIKKEKYKKYYPHGIGHWMGLDVHDEAPYKNKKGEEIPLFERMVLTIEPGIYLPKDDKNIPKKYRGVGIRIEDDVLITKDGYENLSAGIAKSVEEIEELS